MLDQELARLYKLALDDPHLSADQISTLKAMQRGWIKGRNDCWKASVGLETCIAGSYVMRIDELRSSYAGARSDEQPGASDGPISYRCDGFDALVSAVFVNAGMPRVSLKWREYAVVLVTAPSASGAKYLAEDDQVGESMFWTKRDEAIFSPDGDQELFCRAEPID